MVSNRTVGLVAVATFFTMPLTAQAASFNCQTADRPDEVLICQNPQLSALDERMANLYFRLRNDLGGRERRRLVADQVSWLRERLGCGRDYSCIRGLYDRRISELRNY
jgi:uncharacterized protein